MTDYPIGTVLRIRAARALVVGRNNRAAVRKGTETTGTVLAPIVPGTAKGLLIKAAVPGMGDTVCTLWPSDVTILGVVSESGKKASR